MDKQDLVAALHRSHDQLRAVIDTFSDDELALPAQGDWTRRDLVAHLEWWERNSSHIVASLRAGRDPYPSDEPFNVDDRNARTFEENRGRSAADVRAGEAAAWEDLVEAIEAASEADLFDPGRFAWTEGEALAETIHADTDRHWAEHLPNLLPSGHSGGGAAAQER
jgi:hypothetical protein